MSDAGDEVANVFITGKRVYGSAIGRTGGVGSEGPADAVLFFTGEVGVVRLTPR